MKSSPINSPTQGKAAAICGWILRGAMLAPSPATHPRNHQRSETYFRSDILQTLGSIPRFSA
jgi:hypothetical protein